MLVLSAVLFVYLFVYYQAHDPHIGDTTGFDLDGHHSLDPQHFKVIYNVTIRRGGRDDDKVIERGALVIRKDKIVKVVDTWAQAQVTAAHFKSAGAKAVVDGKGAVVLPGLTDAHGHLIEYGLSLSQPDLSTLTSLASIRATLRSHLVSQPAGHYSPTRWLRAHGWDHTKFTDSPSPGAFPSAADLDSDPLLAAVPIMLTRIDVHGYWLNAAAIKLLASIPTLDPPGGVISRDNKGQPTGVFMDTAMALVDVRVPPPSASDLVAAATRAQKELFKVGLTGVHVAGVLPNAMRALADMDKQGELKLRTYAMVRCPDAHGDHVPAGFPAYCPEAFDGIFDSGLPMVDNHQGNWTRRLTVRSVKLFLDGALGSHGAALLEPYTDASNTRGTVVCSEWNCPELKDVVEKWNANGWQVNVHAIGDHANRVAVDALVGISDKGKSRVRVEHAQIVDAREIQRMGEEGIIPSMQPTHATSDMSYAHTRLGSAAPRLLQGAYPWQPLLAAGVPALPLSSDFPVEPPNPLLGLHAAVHMTDPRTGSNFNHSPNGRGKPWFASKVLTRKQAVRGFTEWAAYARFAERALGRIEVGMVADLSVFDRDVMRDGVEIVDAKVVATMVGGVTEYVGEAAEGDDEWSQLSK
ncbi:amidohydrolase family-domain-containing protein [Catenaria anguillulae PL171]|uniref:Amidohydrolase family-domain-containing protein n=1 Tax=Catenaria anguillulae PL171 TaxID=765915 RepID=A0A1Y2H9P8_9FUNG|nr:amidohydrolase family-domain-containing protein [Catenaria anguillulae PL171]